jgi:hypothetical protein
MHRGVLSWELMVQPQWWHIIVWASNKGTWKKAHVGPYLAATMTASSAWLSACRDDHQATLSAPPLDRTWGQHTKSHTTALQAASDTEQKARSTSNAMALVHPANCERVPSTCFPGCTHPNNRTEVPLEFMATSAADRDACLNCDRIPVYYLASVDASPRLEYGLGCID